jgi:hypothetical protein
MLVRDANIENEKVFGGYFFNNLIEKTLGLRHL